MKSSDLKRYIHIPILKRGINDDLKIILNSDLIKERLLSREKYLKKDELNRKIFESEMEQNKFINIAKESPLPTLIIKTDDKNWDEYARITMEFSSNKQQP